MLRKKTQLICVVAASALLVTFSCMSCSYHQRNSHRLVKLTHEDHEKANERNYLYSQQAYGGRYQKDPQLEQYVSDLGYKVIRQLNLNPADYTFTIVNSSIPNLWSFPKGKVALTRGLLTELRNEAELVAVLAHEIAHLQHGHGMINFQEVELNAGPVRLDILTTQQHKDFVVGALGSGSGLITIKYNIASEIEADKTALANLTEMGYSSKAFYDLNKRIYDYYSSDDVNWTGGYLAKHPTSDQKFEASHSLSHSRSQLGAIEVGQFNRKMQNLRSQSNIYEKLDEGYKALVNANYAHAVLIADQGLDLDATEAHFYLLKGKAFLKLGYTLDALNALNRAIDLDPKYFDSYLQRGLVKEQLDDFVQAYTDLEKSLSLLPTAEAYYALGEIDYKQDQHQAAAQKFRKASISKTPGGLKAITKLKEMGLALQGLGTIQVQTLFSNDGYIDLQICNMGLTPQKNIVINVNQTDAKGKSIYYHLVELEDGLEPHQSVRQRTNIGPFFSEEHMKKTIQVNPIYSD